MPNKHKWKVGLQTKFWNKTKHCPDRSTRSFLHTPNTERSLCWWIYGWLWHG